MFKDEKYLKLALGAGEVVWQRGLLRKGYSICHGVAGNAYSFLDLYQTTKVKQIVLVGLRKSEYCV